MDQIQEDKKEGERSTPLCAHQTNNEQPKHWLDFRSFKGHFLIILLTVLTSIIVPYVTQSFIHKNSSAHDVVDNETDLNLFNEDNRPVYAVFGKGNSDVYLKHVHAVLERLGFRQGSIDDEWDLLWAHDYPFRVHKDKIRKLRPHQKINHFPGTGYITNKVDLSTSDLPYIPKAFRLPKDKEKFVEYAKTNPNKRFVQKHNQHRHIHIKSFDEIDFTSNDTFIQEFIDNPYLVDGYKFDVGVYVTITSINPLRVYINEREVLFRYCPVEYYPFDPKIVDKYIVGDDYLPTWEVPSLKRLYFHQKLGMKDSFDTYVRNNGRDPNVVWEQVEDAVRTAILAKEQHIRNILKSYRLKNIFFEMMRFDLVIDANLKVYLMEANMSPNLSSAHFKPNQLLYEQIIYDLFNLVGIGSPVNRESLEKLSTETENMISSDRNIVINGEVCSQEPCTDTCAPAECRFCWPCLDAEDVSILHKAYREHMQKGGNKRIFPKPIINITSYDLNKELRGLSESNAFITKWFYGKCKTQLSWCL